MKRFVKRLFIMSLSVGTQSLHPTSDISDAHGTCKCIAVNLPERLNLHGAGKGNKRIGNQIHFPGDKSYDKKQQHFNYQHNLSPVETLETLKGLTNQGRRGNSEGKE